MAQTAAAPDRPLRADAERNRERILAAAREVFAEHGLDAGLHVIAKRAGVGVGTVYRRFPEKEQLIEALFEDRVAEVLVIAEQALAFEDGWTGLEHFLHGTCELQVADRGMHQLVFQSAKTSHCAAGARERIAPLVAQLVARAQQQGTMRGDIAAFDVGLIRQQVGFVIESLGEAAPAVWPRVLALALDGLRASRSGPTPLPGTSPTPETFEQVLAANKGRRA